MQLSQENLDEFKRLYKKHFNKDIDNQTALDKGIRLIRYMEVVLKEHYKIMLEYGEIPNSEKHTSQ